MNYITVGITLLAIGIVIFVFGVVMLIVSPHLIFGDGPDAKTLSNITLIWGILLLLIGVVVSAGGGIAAAVGFTKKVTPPDRP